MQDNSAPDKPGVAETLARDSKSDRGSLRKIILLGGLLLVLSAATLYWVQRDTSAAAPSCEPHFSVVVPAYNEGLVLPRLLESLVEANARLSGGAKFALVPEDGDVRALLLGDRTVGAGALLRFYVLHCVVVPFVMVLLMAVHFYRVRRNGGVAARY